MLLGLLHMALQHNRHVMLAALIAAMLLAEPMAKALGQSPPAPRPARAGAWLAFAALALALILCAAPRPVPRCDRTGRATPGAALAHVPAALRAQPVLNDYAFGGYLIFEGVRPFIDGRADLYGDAFLARYAQTLIRPDAVVLDQTLRDDHIAWSLRCCRHRPGTAADGRAPRLEAPLRRPLRRRPRAHPWRAAPLVHARRLGAVGRDLAEAASARRSLAEPGCSGRGWSGCGAQPVMVMMSKWRDPPVRFGEALGVERARPGPAPPASAAGAPARPGRWSRPSPAGRPSASAGGVAHASPGRRRPPAGRSRRAAAGRRRRTRRRSGATRRPAPPDSSASAATSAWRSSVRVAPPNTAAMNSPSGFSARRIWISVPGRSLTQCRARLETTRSRLSGANGSASSSTWTRRPPRPASMAPEVGLDQPAHPLPPPRWPPARRRSGRRARRGRRRAESCALWLPGVRPRPRRRGLQEVRRAEAGARRGPAGGGAGGGRTGAAVGSWAFNMAIWGAVWKPGARAGAAIGRALDMILPPQALDGAGPPQTAGPQREAWSKIRFIAEPLCDGCGAPLEYDVGDALRRLPGPAARLRPRPRRLPLRRRLARPDPQAASTPTAPISPGCSPTGSAARPPTCWPRPTPSSPVPLHRWRLLSAALQPGRRDRPAAGPPRRRGLPARRPGARRATPTARAASRARAAAATSPAPSPCPPRARPQVEGRASC